MTKKTKCDPIRFDSIRFFICIHVPCNRWCILFAQFAFGVCAHSFHHVPSQYSFHSVKLGYLFSFHRVALPSIAANAVWSPFLLSRCDRFIYFSFLRRFFLAPFLFNNRNGTSFFVSSFHLVRWFDYKLYACVCASTWLHRGDVPFDFIQNLRKEKRRLRVLNSDQTNEPNCATWLY